MKYILYPGYQLTVDEPAMVEVTALADIQVIGATPTTPVATTVAQTAPPVAPVTVTVSPVAKS